MKLEKVCDAYNIDKLFSIEKLIGDLSGAYSHRINIHHRLVYQVLKEVKTVKVIRMWTHYE